MNIYGFEIKLNSKLLCRAGFEKERSVTTCIVTSLRRKTDDKEELDLHISGLNSETDQSVSWVKQNLKKGDKLSVKVISGDFDPPTSVCPRHDKALEAFILKSKLKTYYALQEELKDHIKEW